MISLSIIRKDNCTQLSYRIVSIIVLNITPMRIFGIIALVFCSSIVLSQDSESTASLVEDMNFFADIMINALEPETRTRAAEAFDGLFHEYLSTGAALQNLSLIHI